MKTYDNYKSSGIDWLGDIPEQWKLIKSKFLADYIKGYAFKTDYFQTVGIPVIKASDIKNLTIRQGKDYLDPEVVKQFDKVKLKCGEIIVSTVGSTPDVINSAVGQIAKVPKEFEGAYLNQNTVKFFCNDKDVLSNDFFFYILLSNPYRKYLDLNAHGTANQASLNIEDMLSFTIAFPTVEEQTAIAKYLDEKTAQIDNLIKNKERLIEMLKEEWLGIINKAVTQGINSHVKLKPSGIDWLGDIPEHWGVKKLKYIGRCQNGISQGADYFGSGYPFVSYGDVYNNIMLPFAVEGLAKSTDEDKFAYSVKEGDVFFTRTSETIEEIGFTSTCIKTIDNATFSGFLIRFRPYKGFLYSGFSKYYFRSQLHRRFFVKEMNLVTRASLSQDLLKRLPVLLPPLN